MSEDEMKLLVKRLNEIRAMEWVENRRPGNDGGVGNTLEDLLNIKENNFSLPDFGSWEIKSQRAQTASLLTLFHMEPSPREYKIVPNILLPMYGWKHQQAGTIYPETERSFRMTITTQFSERGFRVVNDEPNRKIYIDFSFDYISDAHQDMKDHIMSTIGPEYTDPKPFWTYDDISQKLDTKLKNLIYVTADTKVENNKEYYHYISFDVYTEPSLNKFLDLLEDGHIYIDFDARTGHNHGTKFRINPAYRDQIYATHNEI